MVGGGTEEDNQGEYTTTEEMTAHHKAIASEIWLINGRCLVAEIPRLKSKSPRRLIARHHDSAPYGIR